MKQGKSTDVAERVVRAINEYLYGRYQDYARCIRANERRDIKDIIDRETGLAKKETAIKATLKHWEGRHCGAQWYLDLAATLKGA